MITTTLRAMWKDWGFAPALFAQAKQFIEIAKKGESLEACVRASIIFSMMSFEAYFKDVVRGYIEANKATINATALKSVETDLAGRPPLGPILFS